MVREHVDVPAGDRPADPPDDEPDQPRG
jgi:hypothetical protein